MPQSMAVRRTAILFDMNNYWEMEYQKVTFQWSTMGHVHKYYNKLKSIGAPVDVICEDKDFSDYPFLVAPAYQLLDSALVKRWEKYVANGGHLVLSCRTGLKIGKTNFGKLLWGHLYLDFAEYSRCFSIICLTICGER